jgi:hypothetical protein
LKLNLKQPLGTLNPVIFAYTLTSVKSQKNDFLLSGKGKIPFSLDKSGRDIIDVLNKRLLVKHLNMVTDIPNDETVS